MLNRELLIGFFLAAITSSIIWLAFADRQRLLGLRCLDNTPIYTFMIAIDLVLASKQPTFALVDAGMTMKGQAAFRLCIALALLTWAVGWWLGFRFDAYAEQALAKPGGSAYILGHQGEPTSGKFRIKSAWAFWRACHGALLLMLTTLHTSLLLALTELG
jgi:hypothetical protein